MLLSSTAYWGILVVLALIGAGGALAIGSDAVSWSESRAKWGAAFAAAAIGIIGAIWMWFGPSTVVEVTGSNNNIHVETYRLIGSYTVEMPTGPVTMTGKDDHAWVINRSNRDVIIKDFVYSSSPFPNFDDPEIVPPSTARQVRADEFEHIGPGDHPPQTKSSSSGFEVVYWLTW